MAPRRSAVARRQRLPRHGEQHVPPPAATSEPRRSALTTSSPLTGGDSAQYRVEQFGGIADREFGQQATSYDDAGEFGQSVGGRYQRDLHGHGDWHGADRQRCLHGWRHVDQRLRRSVTAHAARRTRKTATCSTSEPRGGTHNIVATYSGDGANNASTSATLSQVVNSVTKVSTNTTLGSTPNPSPAVGTAVTFTAAVTPLSGGGTPTGTVTFKDGKTTIGSGALNGRRRRDTTRRRP